MYWCNLLYCIQWSHPQVCLRSRGFVGNEEHGVLGVEFRNHAQDLTNICHFHELHVEASGGSSLLPLSRQILGSSPKCCRIASTQIRAMIGSSGPFAWRMVSNIRPFGPSRLTHTCWMLGAVGYVWGVSSLQTAGASLTRLACENLESRRLFWCAHLSKHLMNFLHFLWTCNMLDIENLNGPLNVDSRLLIPAAKVHPAPPDI